MGNKQIPEEQEDWANKSSPHYQKLAVEWGSQLFRDMAPRDYLRSNGWSYAYANKKY